MRPYPPDTPVTDWDAWYRQLQQEQAEWAECEAAFDRLRQRAEYRIEAAFLHLPSVRQAVSRQADWLLNHCYACGCETEAATCPACGADLACPF